MKTFNRPIMKFGFLFIILMIAVFAFINFPDKKALIATPSQPTPVAKASLGKDDFKLNGIFISDRYKTTMINNQFYQVGDIIKGMEIASIDYDKVKLKNVTMQLELSSIGNNA